MDIQKIAQENGFSVITCISQLPPFAGGDSLDELCRVALFNTPRCDNLSWEGYECFAGPVHDGSQTVVFSWEEFGGGTVAYLIGQGCGYGVYYDTFAEFLSAFGEEDEYNPYH